MSQPISELTKEIRALDSKLTKEISEQSVQITQVGTTVMVVGAIASTLGLGPTLLKYLLAWFSQK